MGNLLCCSNDKGPLDFQLKQLNKKQYGVLLIYKENYNRRILSDFRKYEVYNEGQMTPNDVLNDVRRKYSSSCNIPNNTLPILMV